MLILEHVARLDTFFAEAARVLVGGGNLFLCELHPMRQLTGGQAQFSNSKTGERQRIAAFLHDVSEYVNTGWQPGLCCKSWVNGATPTRQVNSTPRLLSLHFQR
jgi:malonyl-CoA O-methyltransferase